MITDMGLVKGWIYRTILSCDAPGCGSRFSLDIDKYLVEDARSADIRNAEMEQFIEQQHWLVTPSASAPFYAKHFCPDHAPQQ